MSPPKSIRLTAKHTKGYLADEFSRFCYYAEKKGIIITPKQLFALGYMSARCNLRSFFNKTKVAEAVKFYDRNDDLGLGESMTQIFLDLGILKQDDLKE